MQNGLMIYPCDTIKELMNDNNLTIEDLGKNTNCPIDYISDVLKNGKEKIIKEFAYKLELVFNISNLFWLNLQDICEKVNNYGII